MNFTRLKDSIKNHEGFSGVPYPDRGKVSIAYGRNLTDNPLSHAEGEYLMVPQVFAAIQNAQKLVPNWHDLNDARQNVLIEMVYNLGFGGAMGFKKMWAALAAGDFAAAGTQMRDSAWYTQVGNRAERLAIQMETGAFV